MMLLLMMVLIMGMIGAVDWPRGCHVDRGAHDGDGGIEGRRLLLRRGLRLRGWVLGMGSLDKRKEVLAAVGRRRRSEVASTAVHGGGGVVGSRGWQWNLS